MDPQVGTEVLAALGLDVVDVHLLELFDALDLESLRRLVAVALELQARLELVGLRRIDEADLVGECRPITERPDRERPTTVPVLPIVLLETDTGEDPVTGEQGSAPL